MPQYIMLVNFTDQGLKGVKKTFRAGKTNRFDLGAFRRWTGAPADV